MVRKNYGKYCDAGRPRSPYADIKQAKKLCHVVTEEAMLDMEKDDVQLTCAAIYHKTGADVDIDICQSVDYKKVDKPWSANETIQLTLMKDVDKQACKHLQETGVDTNNVDFCKDLEYDDVTNELFGREEKRSTRNSKKKNSKKKNSKQKNSKEKRTSKESKGAPAQQLTVLRRKLDANV
jgi:poly(A) polymerase Pap1